jgi:hypothetical protein
MRGCGRITGAGLCAVLRAGPRGRAGLRRLSDVIHLAIDVPATEEKQRKRGERERSGNDCEIEEGNGFHDLAGCL